MFQAPPHDGAREKYHMFPSTYRVVGTSAVGRPAAAPCPHDGYPMAGDGVVQSVASLGPALVEAIVGLVFAAFRRVAESRRGRARGKM